MRNRVDVEGETGIGYLPVAHCCLRVKTHIDSTETVIKALMVRELFSGKTI